MTPAELLERIGINYRVRIPPGLASRYDPAVHLVSLWREGGDVWGTLSVASQDGTLSLIAGPTKVQKR